MATLSSPTRMTARSTCGRRGGERVRALLTRLDVRLRLRVNEGKSAVASVFTRSFLGFAFWAGPGGRVQVRVAIKALARMKDRVREMTRRRAGRSLGQVAQKLRSYRLGWRGDFGLASILRVVADLDGWIRRASGLFSYTSGNAAQRSIGN